MKNLDFFKKQTSSSKIKANIVASYFPSYCRIIDKAKQNAIGYLDLFAGPGIYEEDKALSTPILIADEIAKDVNLKAKVQLMFNDNRHIDTLKSHFEQRYEENTFEKDPVFGSKTVGNDKKINEWLVKKHEGKNPMPTLLFFDPWGYKGINTITLAKFMENWGNEIFLFLNIKRIHAAVENEKFDDLMRDLFPTTIDDIRKERRYTSNVSERLALIIDKLSAEYIKLIPDGVHVSAFKFIEEDSIAVSHYVIHFTKHSRGFELVKQTFYDYDNIGADLESAGVYTFDAKKKKYNENNSLNFGDPNIIQLSNTLYNEYKGKTLTADKLFKIHQKKTSYCATHYSLALRQLVKDQKITSEFTDQKDHKVNVLLTKYCKLTFPK